MQLFSAFAVTCKPSNALLMEGSAGCELGLLGRLGTRCLSMVPWKSALKLTLASMTVRSSSCISTCPTLLVHGTLGISFEADCGKHDCHVLMLASVSAARCLSVVPWKSALKLTGASRTVRSSCLHQYLPHAACPWYLGNQL